jgi:SAM-dependent methyltransferase
MAYADITVNDPNRIKRWIQRQRFRDALKVLERIDPGAPTEILDFGGGDGELIRQCLQAHPQLRACLYEPTPRQRTEAEAKLSAYEVEMVDDLRHVKGRRFDFVFCLEVFEHLPAEATRQAIADIHQLLKPGGLAVLGVPHELFLPALAKGMFRMMRRFGAFDARPLNVLRAAVGRPPAPRPVKEIAPGLSYHFYHLGFDHRELELLLTRRFEIVSRWFSPARALGSVLNSEVYYLLRPSPVQP